MNVITFASRKGGAGKSTLTAHLAAFAHRLGRRCLLVDADPQGSLTLWHAVRDTAPTMWVVVQEAIRAATLVIVPARPGFFDLAAVRETVTVARQHNKPYAVVINAAPVKRDEREAPAVVQSRVELDKLSIPVWSGQISQRASYMVSLAAGASVGEMQSDSAAMTEIARLWTAIERSVDAINGLKMGADVAQGKAA
jgi:chromosome partitioning protein